MLRRALPSAALVAAVALAASPAASAEIVYRAPDGGIAGMNDDGSGQNELITPAQGAFGYDSQTSVAPNGSLVAFSSGEQGQATCSHTLNCVGLYAFGAGAALRLTAPPMACPNAGSCTTFDNNPSVTTDGRVYFMFDIITGTLDCAPGGCIDYQSGGAGIFVRSMDGSDQPTAVPFPDRTGTYVTNGLVMNANVPIVAADPQDPNSLAYQGGPATGCTPVDVESTSDPDSSAKRVGCGNPNGSFDGLEWSPDATKIAGFDTSSTVPGIWVYSTEGSPTTGAWVLDDTQSDYGFTFAGNDELVFEYNNNLYSLPSSCWATQTSTSSPVANCTVANATAITTGGTSAAPYRYPSWTSAAVPGFAVPPPPLSAPPPAPVVATPTVQQAGLTAHGAITSKTGVAFDVTLSAAGTIDVTISKLPAPAGAARVASASSPQLSRGKKKPKPKLIGTVTFPGKAGSNLLTIHKVHGHALAPGRYEASVTVSGAPSGTTAKNFTFKVAKAKPKRK